MEQEDVKIVEHSAETPTLNPMMRIVSQTMMGVAGARSPEELAAICFLYSKFKQARLNQRLFEPSSI